MTHYKVLYNLLGRFVMLKGLRRLFLWICVYHFFFLVSCSANEEVFKRNWAQVEQVTQADQRDILHRKTIIPSKLGGVTWRADPSEFGKECLALGRRWWENAVCITFYDHSYYHLPLLPTYHCILFCFAFHY